MVAVWAYIDLVGSDNLALKIWIDLEHFGEINGKFDHLRLTGLVNFAHIYDAQQHSIGVQLWQGETASLFKSFLAGSWS